MLSPRDPSSVRELRHAQRPWPVPAPGLRRCTPAGTGSDYRKKSRLEHRGCIQSPCRRECTAGVRELGKRGTATSPPDSVPRGGSSLCIQSTRNPPGAQCLSLSLSLSLSPQNQVVLPAQLLQCNDTFNIHM